MLRKDSALKWTLEEKQSFEAIKEALTKTPVLISPNFNKSDHTPATYHRKSICKITSHPGKNQEGFL